MEEMKSPENREERGKKPNVPNMSVVKGVLAIIFGLLLVVFAHKIILQIIFFVSGLFLIYYGLVVLKIRQVTDYIDSVVSKVRRFFVS